MGEIDFGKLLAELDNSDMAGFTRNFVDDLRNSMSMDVNLEEDSDWSGVLCLGMGGSGAGGQFLKALSDESGGLPFVFWNDYGLPSWWGSDWLVFATSYSGNTEETLSGTKEAIENNGTVVGVCSGGKLEEILEGADGSVCLKVPSGQMPRSAFGHIFGTQLAACWSLGLMQKPNPADISKMLERLDRVSKESDLANASGSAAILSQSLLEKEIGIVAPNCLFPAAYRFTCQINENAAKFARSTGIPEMNHNEVVAWAGKESSRQSLVVFTCDELHYRTVARIEWVLENIAASPSWRIECEGESLLERLLYAAHVTDWVSIGLAVLSGEDPSEMAPIDSLKEHLGSLQ